MTHIIIFRLMKKQFYFFTLLCNFAELAKTSVLFVDHLALFALMSPHLALSLFHFALISCFFTARDRARSRLFKRAHASVRGCVFTLTPTTPPSDRSLALLSSLST
jgi:hypothetical protein